MAAVGGLEGYLSLHNLTIITKPAEMSALLNYVESGVVNIGIFRLVVLSRLKNSDFKIIQSLAK